MSDEFDMVEEILKRSPVKSLLRFRCVCKSWRSTIDAPYFVALHREQSSHWHLACLDLGGPNRPCAERNPSYLFSGKSLAGPPSSQIEIPFVAPTKSYVIAGSCNGLIYIKEEEDPGEGFDYTMYVWNLFTRKYKAVPQPLRRAVLPRRLTFHL
ncbi:hypothetical protein BT93_I0035 [Corymbia citriodora subsp. variegata]|nr:hypothetical protein BT93_I0035 [Corymbia citriodora subsp. variegata]